MPGLNITQHRASSGFSPDGFCLLPSLALLDSIIFFLISLLPSPSLKKFLFGQPSPADLLSPAEKEGRFFDLGCSLCLSTQCELLGSSLPAKLPQYELGTLAAAVAGLLPFPYLHLGSSVCLYDLEIKSVRCVPCRVYLLPLDSLDGPSTYSESLLCVY